MFLYFYPRSSKILTETGVRRIGVGVNQPDPLLWVEFEPVPQVTQESVTRTLTRRHKVTSTLNFIQVFYTKIRR